jgi:endonuclease/exonuclease/phosphatase family metal-dependent hydrolase
MSETFRLAAFNLENLDWSPAREAQFGRRLSVLRPILRALAADVLCLQEVGAQKSPSSAPRRFLALQRLLEGTDYAAFHRATTVRPGASEPSDVHNLAILSRWPILETRQLHHDIVARWSWTPPPDDAASSDPVDIVFDRPLLYARIALPRGAPLHVVNLHLRAPRAVPLAPARGAGSSRALVEGQFAAALKREGQALEARLLAERIFDAEPAARLAVCGDFNADEHDAPTRILRGARDEDLPASPRALVALEERVAPARRYTVIHAGRPVLIDHILASPALAAACEEVEILNGGLQDEVFAVDPIEGSLHAPLVATIGFLEAP